MKNHHDDVLEELWQAKDYYSLSCNSDFRELVKKIQEACRLRMVFDTSGNHPVSIAKTEE